MCKERIALSFFLLHPRKEYIFINDYSLHHSGQMFFFIFWNFFCARIALTEQCKAVVHMLRIASIFKLSFRIRTTKTTIYYFEFSFQALLLHTKSFVLPWPLWWDGKIFSAQSNNFDLKIAKHCAGLCRYLNFCLYWKLYQVWWYCWDCKKILFDSLCEKSTLKRNFQSFFLSTHQRQAKLDRQ